MRAIRIAMMALVVGALSGCAVQRYRPEPIVPSAAAARFETRTLADPGLRAFIEARLGHPMAPWPPTAWDLADLSLAALYFNPSLDLPRARLATAAAAIATAAARPNPTLDLVPGIPAPYLLTQDVLFLFETAGKRARRVQAAEQLDQAARLDLADAAWHLLVGVRVALLNDLVAARNLALLRSEARVREDQVAILDRIASAGELTSLDVDTARIELSHTSVAIHTAEGQVGEARAALTAAIGLPVAGLGGADLSWPTLDAPPAADSLSVDRIQRDAVVNRLDVRRALADYEVAEAVLRGEVAKQYPNVTLGPGYTYEERHSFFTVGLSTSLPIFNRNQGPIAEAEGHRQEAAAAFMQTQAHVIAGSERALALYTAALRELAETQSLYGLQEHQLATSSKPSVLAPTRASFLTACRYSSRSWGDRAWTPSRGHSGRSAISRTRCSAR